MRKPMMQVPDALNEKALEDNTLGIDHLTVHGLRRTMNKLLRQVTHGEVVRSVTGHVAGSPGEARNCSGPSMFKALWSP